MAQALIFLISFGILISASKLNIMLPLLPPAEKGSGDEDTSGMMPFFNV